MGWALDASALARDTGDGVALRVGARTGVATTGGAVPADAAEEARSLAREASPDRPRFVGGSGRATSGLYALREVPAARRPGRRSKIIEVVGTRTFGERDHARRVRRGKLFGRAAPLAQLDHLARARDGDRPTPRGVITGAAGTGKSRLWCAELVARHPETRAITVGGDAGTRFAPRML